MCFSTFNLIQHGNLNNSQWCNWYMCRLFLSISVSYKCTLAKFHTWYLIVMVLQQLSFCHTIITRKKCSVAISLGNKGTELKWLTVTSVLSNWDIVLTASKWEKKFHIWVKWVCFLLPARASWFPFSSSSQSKALPISVTISALTCVGRVCVSGGCVK